MKHVRFLLALMVLVLPIFVANAQVQNESRLALLIGNATYKSSPLQNPVNDVRLMEKALTEAGFTIIKAENATRREMQRMVRDFGERLKQSGGVGLFLLCWPWRSS
jgi:Caspase domain